MTTGMLVILWSSLCLLNLCCKLDLVKGDATFDNMKEAPLSTKQVHRTFRAADSCYDIDGNQVANGQSYVPSGNNACVHCKCVSGGPEECFTTKCAVPTCQKYKALPGKCCAYTCLDESTEKAELAIIVSLSVGLVLLLLLLGLVIHRNRKRLRRRQHEEPAMDPEERGPLNNQLTPIQEETEGPQEFEPPPPYTPICNVHKCKASQIHNSRHPPNEPPPPYHIDSNLRATPV
ncbi:integral membrane protein DGCR2/IDD isoform X2 [Nematostella vectensis]|uniref:integral membrane protein DGCR2/IDD isoform X2 n=1 Tax=Nematostella vectensis TaxID=45351 RepID=UPI00207752F5|nr:integral membrane protein DGCR2/IDD isoform X2 [Nematostella vectensis]